MPYLLVMGPDFSFEQRKIMAAELTDAIMQALDLPQGQREQITIHFATYPPDALSVGGRLLSEIEERVYFCKILDCELTQEKKERVNAVVFPLLMELFGLDTSQAGQVTLLFQDCPLEDVVVGGRFLWEISAFSV